jgi:multimeric flavodoxin WrbA
MKILAIMSSPRKKDSYNVTQKIESLISEKQNVGFEYIFLNEYELLQCKGCGICLQRGEQYCPLKDDRDVILDKMLLSDGIIFVTPSYVFQISSNLKIFIERFAFLSCRPRFFEKTAMIIATCSSPGYGLKEPINYLRLVLFAWGFKKTYDIGIIVPVGYKASEKKMKENEKAMIKATELFYSSITDKEKFKPSFNLIMQFKVLKIHAEALRETYTADYKYYKDLEFYTTSKINPMKVFFANILKNMIHKKLKKVVQTE